MMRTVDQAVVAAPPDLVFEIAADVERWPEILPHYRWVRMTSGTRERGVVEMAAYRPFGPLNWPTWWQSDMAMDRTAREVRYRHIRGITAGMDVLWRVTPHDAGSHILLTHDWAGPRWPLIRRPAAEWVIGPVFVHGIATRTIAGVARAAEARHG